MSDYRKEAVLNLIKSARLSEDQVEGLLAQALDKEYWARLNPTLSVCGQSQNQIERTGFCRYDIGSQVDRFAGEGYFHTGPILPSALMSDMCSCVERLRLAKWPQTFAFVYDQFWEIARA